MSGPALRIFFCMWPSVKKVWTPLIYIISSSSYLLFRAGISSVCAAPARRWPPCPPRWGWSSAWPSCARALQHPQCGPDPEAAHTPDCHWGRWWCCWSHTEHTGGGETEYKRITNQQLVFTIWLKQAKTENQGAQTHSATMNIQQLVVLWRFLNWNEL